MVKTERSAGVIPFRKTGGGVEYLLLKNGKYWDFPKGHLEKGETDLQAAVRELNEETGINDVELVPGFAHEICYFFRVKGKLVSKTVLYFLGETRRKRIRVSDEHQDYAFLTVDDARKRLSHANSRALLNLAHVHLSDASGRLE